MKVRDFVEHHKEHMDYEIVFSQYIVIEAGGDTFGIFDAPVQGVLADSDTKEVRFILEDEIRTIFHTRENVN